MITNISLISLYVVTPHEIVTQSLLAPE